MALTRNQIAGINGAATHQAHIARTGMTYFGTRAWSLADDDLIRQLFPDLDTLCQRLPYRTASAVSQRAGRLGLKTPKACWSANERAALKPRYPTEEPVAGIADSLGRSKPQVWSKGHNMRLRRPRRRPLPAADPLVDAVRQRAFELGISLCGLDRDLRLKKYFALRNPPRNRLAIAKAVRLLGGQFEIDFS